MRWLLRLLYLPSLLSRIGMQDVGSVKTQSAANTTKQERTTMTDTLIYSRGTIIILRKGNIQISVIAAKSLFCANLICAPKWRLGRHQ